MKNKVFLADGRLFNPSTRSYINEERVIADYRYTQYAEGDLLLDVIKEGLTDKKYGQLSSDSSNSGLHVDNEWVNRLTRHSRHGSAPDMDL
jgi:hypothetical protein